MQYPLNSCHLITLERSPKPAVFVIENALGLNAKTVLFEGYQTRKLLAEPTIAIPPWMDIDFSLGANFQIPLLNVAWDLIRVLFYKHWSYILLGIAAPAIPSS